MKTIYIVVSLILRVVTGFSATEGLSHTYQVLEIDNAEVQVNIVIQSIHVSKKILFPSLVNLTICLFHLNVKILAVCWVEPSQHSCSFSIPVIAQQLHSR